MKTCAILSLFVALASAQSYSSAPAPQASGYAIIPSGLSDGCSAFITSFDSNATLTACTKSLIQATQNFGPGGSGNSSPSTAEVTGAIDSICTGAVSTACPDSLIGGKLSDFYAACSAELTSNPNQQIRDVYDVLYALIPFKQAICAKDDSGNYCAIAGNNSSAPTGVDLSQVQQTLSYTPPSSNVVLANLTTFNASNLAFLFRQPEMDSSTLCTTCTRNILTAYFNYESSTIYASGLANSQVLGGQTDLVGNIQSKCGANFLSGAVQAAGGIKQGAFGDSDAAVKGVSDRLAALTAVAAGVLTVAASFL